MEFLTKRKTIKNFLGMFSDSQWEIIISYTLEYGILNLLSKYSIEDLNITRLNEILDTTKQAFQNRSLSSINHQNSIISAQSISNIKRKKSILKEKPKTSLITNQYNNRCSLNKRSYSNINNATTLNSKESILEAHQIVVNSEKLNTNDFVSTPTKEVSFDMIQNNEQVNYNHNSTLKVDKRHTYMSNSNKKVIDTPDTKSARNTLPSLPNKDLKFRVSNLNKSNYSGAPSEESNG